MTPGDSSGSVAAATTHDPRWLAPSDDFLRPMLELAELALIDDSCADERRLHERLVAAPRCDVDPGQLAAIADADARDNYAVFLAFRDALVAAGSLEAYYLRLVRSGSIAVPPAFLDAVVAAIVARLLDVDASAIERRAAQLLHRTQRIAVQDGRVLCADRDAADRASASSSGVDLVRRLVAGGSVEASDLPVLSAANASAFERAADPFSFVLDLTHEVVNDVGHGLAFTLARSDSGMTALARVLERWIAHFLDVATTIRPVQRIDDPAWRWHVGIDAEATTLLNDLYRGEAPEPDRLERLIGLFRLDFADPLEMRADVAGKPVYLGLAMSAEQTLKLKPQNLLVNLPLAAPT
ncbi:MAG TPA: DUF6352 family protein [Caldimonas sp.]|nr:DUF6352 family protein [Caldimonas sp.]